MNIDEEIKWRGSTYKLEKVEDDQVFWYNPVSRHHGQCSIDSWKAFKPYGDHYN